MNKQDLIDYLNDYEDCCADLSEFGLYLPYEEIYENSYEGAATLFNDSFEDLSVYDLIDYISLPDFEDNVSVISLDEADVLLSQKLVGHVPLNGYWDLEGIAVIRNAKEGIEVQIPMYETYEFETQYDRDMYDIDKY